MRIIVYSLDEIPEFASEDEEREWWATHDLAPELGEDVTEQQHALIQRLKATCCFSNYFPRIFLDYFNSSLVIEARSVRAKVF